MKRIAFFTKSYLLTSIITTILSFSVLYGQTVLISPTGDGGFETGTTFAANGWFNVNAASNLWDIGTAATPYAGAREIHVAQTAGTYSYDNGTSRTSHFYRDVFIPAGSTTITLSFYWKGKGESGYDRGLVYTAPNTVTPVANAPSSSSTTITGATLVWTQPTFTNSATYTLATITLPDALAGTTVRLIFTWQNDGSVGTSPGTAIDNISLTCVVPTPCAGTPAGGTTTATVTTGCSGFSSILSVTGGSTESGITYQWESSPDNSTWTNVAGATNATYTAIVNSTIYYRRKTTCTAISQSSYSASIQLITLGCYLISNPTTETICSGFFYDSGSNTANYSASESYTKTICAMAGQYPRVTFTVFNTESLTYDYLKIYDGNSTAAPLIGTWGGTTGPGTITGNNTCLTYKFTSDGSGQYAGWEATLSCVSPCSGTPTGGTTAATVINGCIGYTSILSILGATTDPGLTYQWQSSPTATGPWTNVAGATNASYTTTVGADVFYRRVTTCTSSGNSANSVEIGLTVSPCIIMANGTVTACSGTFYDNGGTSNYTASQNLTQTICATAGLFPQVDFTSFKTESLTFDYLKIYNGNSTAAPLIGTWGGNAGPGTIIGANNCLTFQFISDGSSQYAGWTATLSCVAPCSGTPIGGTAVSSGCSSFTSTVSITGVAPTGGSSYQWQSAPAATGPWTNVAGATGATYTATITADIYYRRVTTCTASGLSANSSAVQLTMASCLPPPCLSNPAAGDLITTATPICNLNGYCGNTSSSYTIDSPGDLSFCGSIDNNSWLSFVADDVTATLNVFVSNCEDDFGIQMEIYSTPDFLTFTSHSNCWNPGVEEDGVITATALIPGQTYYLMIDGYAGDVCDYVISASSGVMTVDAGPDVSICSGQSTTLTATGGTTYQWSPTTGLSNPNIANPIASPTTTTTYTVSVTGGNTLCPSAATDQVTVTISSTTPTASNNGPICVGSTLNLTSLPNGGTAYAWSGPNSFTSNLQNPTIPATSSVNDGLYTVTVTLAGGCTGTAQTAVTINSLLSPTATSNSPICASATLNLTSSIGTSYLWSGPNNFSSTLQNPSITNATTLATGSYFVTVTATGGCTGTAQTDVIVNPAPSPSASNNGPLCGGNTLNLTALPIGATSYNWSGPNGFNSNIQNPSVTNVTTAHAGIYSVTVTGTGGCTASAQTTLAINGDLTVTPTSNSPVCENETLNLSVPIAGATYVWSGPNVFTSAIQNPSIPNAATIATGTYSVTVTNASGCSGTSTVNVIVNALPTPSIAGNLTICAGKSTILTASGGNSYQWSNSTFNPSITVSPATQTTYTVTATTAAGCSATTSQTVLVNANPNITNIATTNELCNSGNGQAIANVSQGLAPYQYSWSNGGPNNPTNTTHTAGQYTVTITDANGCTTTSAYTIQNIPGPQLTIRSVFPDHCEQGIGSATVEVNNTGTYTYSWLTTPPQIGQTASGLTSGSYIVMVTDGLCSDTLTVPVNNVVGPTAEFEPNPHSASASNSIIRFMNESNGGTNYQWTFGDGATSTETSPLHVYIGSNTYTVTLLVTDDYNCLDSISKTVVIYDDMNVYIPNAFSPNSDNINEVFRPYGTGVNSTKPYEMKIFDRWGRLVFISNKFEKGWDGAIDGERVKMNTVFTYRIALYDYANKLHVYVGSFSLLGSTRDGEQ